MTAILAQFQPKGGAGQADPFKNETFLIIFIGAVLVGLTIGLAIQVFFLLTLSKALKRCSAENRTMEPGMVWLNLVPVFSMFWFFVTVSRIADSLRNEFVARRMDEPGESYGRTVGMTYAICQLINVPISGLSTYLSLTGNPQPLLGCITTPIGLTILICWIMYWVKIAGYSRELAESGYGGYGRPRNRRRRDDDDDDGSDDDYERPRGGGWS